MIPPPVGGGRRNYEGLVALGLFGAGAVLAAAGFGWLLGAFGRSILTPTTETARLLAIATGALAGSYGIGSLVGHELPVLSRHWQIPRAISGAGKFTYATVFGVILGLGFVTVVPYVGLYIVALYFVAIHPTPSSSAQALVLFALGRTAPIAYAVLRNRVDARMPPHVRVFALVRASEWIRTAVLTAIGVSLLERTVL